MHSVLHWDGCCVVLVYFCGFVCHGVVALIRTASQLVVVNVVWAALSWLTTSLSWFVFLWYWSVDRGRPIRLRGMGCGGIGVVSYMAGG